MHETPRTVGEVRQFYDAMTDLMVETYGADLHMGYWNDHRGYWNDPPDNDSLQDATARMTDQLIERLAAGAGDQVLDVGCGIGHAALRLARACDVEVCGVSISPHQVEKARLRARHEGQDKKVRFENANAMCLPYAADTFDGAWAIESLSHMELDRALAEISRVLRPGGRFVVSDGMLDNSADDAARTRIKSLCRAIHMNLPPTKYDYLRFFAAARLRLVDLRDITDRTRHSATYFMQSLTRKIDSADNSPLGRSLQGIAATMHSLMAEPALRYVVITTQRQ
jgi:ubiquinone/menaquinone biosynthesis C-methylase UbiE